MKDILCVATHSETGEKLIVKKINRPSSVKFVIESMNEDDNILDKYCIAYLNNELYEQAKKETSPIIFRHFKGGIYKLITSAIDKNGEYLVIYQNISQKDKYMNIYARPIDMFFDEVDHKKYPDIKQKYRLEIIKGGKYE